MKVALLLLLYTDFIINFYQLLPCVNYLCCLARSLFVLKHITSDIADDAGENTLSWSYA